MATSKEREIERDKKVDVILEKLDKLLELLEKGKKKK